MPKHTSKTTVTESVAQVEVEQTNVYNVDEEDSEINNYITPEQFDITKFYLKPVEDKLSKGSQYLAFPKYKYGKKTEGALTIVTDTIKLTKGGIPRIDGEYKKTDGDRMFFWFGQDPEQKASVEFFNVLRQIDEFCSEQVSKNSDTKFVSVIKDGKKEALDKLEYVALVRESSTPENAEKKVEPYERIKVKFNTKYDKDLPEGQVSEITTGLFLYDKEDSENLSTVTDFEKYLRWNCEAKFILQINKCWAMKAVKNKKRECGLTIKCLQVYITKEAPSSGLTSSDRFKKRLFIGGSSASTTQSTSSAKSTVTQNTKPAHKEESDDSDEESSEEEVAVKETKTQSKKQPTKQAKEESDESREEEDDSSEEKEETKEVEETSEESDSEDSPPPPPKKGGKQTVTKKKQSTEESESSEEKPKPKGKSFKK